MSKVIEEKISFWRNKDDKAAYLSTFYMGNWSEGKTIIKEMKTAHLLTNCKACTKVNLNLQATFPLSKKCMTVKKDLLNEIQRDANKHTAQHTLQKGSKITNKELNTVLG